MLLQRRYEFILFPNYFITVVYYYRTHPILFLYFFSIPTFLHFKIFSLLVSFVFIWNLQFHTDQIQCFICTYNVLYAISLDSTIAGSKITLIICSFLVQRINLKYPTMLNCIHAYHVSNNLNGVKPQSHGCHNHEIHKQKMSSFF